MEYVVTIQKYDQINNFQDADSFLLGDSSFCVRPESFFNKKEIKRIKQICEKQGKKLYVLVNKIFFDYELKKVEDYLAFLKEIDVDGIFFCDFSVYMIAKKLKIEEKLVFYHETFLRSASDIQTYIDVGFKKIVISKDAHIDDINNIDAKYKDSIGIFAHGYFPIYYSKRKTITNHFKRFNLKENKEKLYHYNLKENSRDELYPIIENKNGTIIYYHTPLCYINEMKTLKEKVSFVVIDSVFETTENIKKWLSFYKKSVEENVVYDEDLTKNYTTGFLKQKAGVK